MRIGFDAKRLFYNRSGLGNYSYNLINTLRLYYPQNEYILYTPSTKGAIRKLHGNTITIKTPNKTFDKIFNSWWRSYRLSIELLSDKIDLFHGLSNELPNNIHKTGVKSLVTIHDLIFIRYPEQYKFFDRKIYTNKSQYACKVADRIIAVSNQTKNDLIEFFKVDEHKIDVVYQGCNPLFYDEWPDKNKQIIKQKYDLPDNYILFVGTIQERKNILSVLKALHQYNIDVSFVIIGKPTSYINELHKYIAENKMKQKILFFHDVVTEELPAFYQMAKVFVWPSMFEGFGIPILEALNSKIPVITSQSSCLYEVGGSATLYVDLFNIEDLALQIQRVLSDTQLRNSMIQVGYNHALKFRDICIAQNIINVYQKVIEQ